MNQTFSTVEVAWPNFHLRFVATNERIHRVMEMLIPEVIEAEREFKDRNKPDFEI